MIMSVSSCRKVEPVAVAPTVTPRKIVTMFISSFCAVLDRRSTTPDSRNRLPSISIPTSGAAEGTSSDTKMVTTIGKMIFSVWKPDAAAPSRCALFLGRKQPHDRRLNDRHQRHIGIGRDGDRAQQVRRQLRGDINGRRAVRTADDTDGRGLWDLKPNTRARIKARKIPSCAAAPSSRLLGLAISGPKSVIAPTPMKMSGG